MLKCEVMRRLWDLLRQNISKWETARTLAHNVTFSIRSTGRNQMWEDWIGKCRRSTEDAVLSLSEMCWISSNLLCQICFRGNIIVALCKFLFFSNQGCQMKTQQEGQRGCGVQSKEWGLYHMNCKDCNQQLEQRFNILGELHSKLDFKTFKATCKMYGYWLELVSLARHKAQNQPAHLCN